MGTNRDNSQQNEKHIYRKGSFPRYLMVEGKPVKVKVTPKSVKVGCTMITKEVIESLLHEMNGYPVSEEFEKEVKQRMDAFERKGLDPETA